LGWIRHGTVRSARKPEKKRASDIPASPSKQRFAVQLAIPRAVLLTVYVTAKKLKRDWIEKQKIKSRWKAQKRKEGLDSSQPRIHPLVPEDLDNEEAKGEGGLTRNDNLDTGSNHASERETDDEGDSVRIGDDSDEDMPEDDEPQARPRSSTRSRKGPSKTSGEDAEEKPSLRELNRQAYSRSSLHSHKSDPLHRHGRGRGSKSAAVNGRGRGGGRDRGRGAGPSDRGGRKGQPDMRLRMNAMLEKIKRDYA
jgi:hypothetical protein